LVKNPSCLIPVTNPPGVPPAKNPSVAPPANNHPLFRIHGKSPPPELWGPPAPPRENMRILTGWQTFCATTVPLHPRVRNEWWWTWRINEGTYAGRWDRFNDTLREAWEFRRTNGNLHHFKIVAGVNHADHLHVLFHDDKGSDGIVHVSRVQTDPASGKSKPVGTSHSFFVQRVFST
jgi:hypothetical protein